MAICPWKKSYCVGDAAIDNQHEYLFALANDMVEAKDKPALTNNAMKLFSYVREHFNHEEAVMREIGYPGYREHVGMHEALITQLSAIAAGIHADRWSVRDLRQFMNIWLAVHIVEEDTKLGGFIQKA